VTVQTKTAKGAEAMAAPEGNLPAAPRAEATPPAPVKPEPKRKPKANPNAARDRRRASNRSKNCYAAIALARKHSVDAVEYLVSVMTDPEAEISDRLRAAKEILDRGMGKPVARKAVAHSINDEHLAALKRLADEVGRLPDQRAEPGQHNGTVIDAEATEIPPEERDRAKLTYASKAIGRT